jgi:hypothetical protein
MKTALIERDVSHLVFPDEAQIIDAEIEGPPGAPDGPGERDSNSRHPKESIEPGV